MHFCNVLLTCGFSFRDTIQMNTHLTNLSSDSLSRNIRSEMKRLQYPMKYICFRYCKTGTYSEKNVFLREKVYLPPYSSISFVVSLRFHFSEAASTLRRTSAETTKKCSKYANWYLVLER